MAAVTVSHSDKSFILLLGSMKIEFVHIQSPSDGDTYSSKLANPSYATLLPAADAGGTFAGSASVSGKTVTVHDPASSINHLLLVFGDALT